MMKLFYILVGSAILFYYRFTEHELMNIGQANIYFQDIVTIIILTYMFFYFLLHKNLGRLLKLSSTKWFLFYVLWGLVAIIRGYLNFGFHSIGEARWYLSGSFYYFFIIIFFKNIHSVNKFLKICIISIFIMIFYNFIEYYLINRNIELVNQSSFRFINVTQALLVASIFIGALFSYLNNSSLIAKKYALFYIFIFLIIIIVVQHRTIWIATFFAIIATVYFSKKIAVLKIIVIFSIVLLVFASFLPVVNRFFNTNAYEIIKKSVSFISDPREDPTGSWRLIGWGQELEKFQNNPIFGEGLGNYSEWYVNGQWLRVMVHNGYIMNLSKFGVLGLFILLLGIFCWYRELNKFINLNNIQATYDLARLLKILMFLNLIYITFYSFTMFFWIILGVGSTLIQIPQHAEKGLITLNKLKSSLRYSS